MRDDFTPKTKTLIAQRVSHLCSKPDCRVMLIAAHSRPEKSISMGIAAHICAAASGGPRYDNAMTTEQRKSADNGIWLCCTHSVLIDKDPDEYPVALLKMWKTEAEVYSKQLLNEPMMSEKEASAKLQTLYQQPTDPSGPELVRVAKALDQTEVALGNMFSLLKIADVPPDQLHDALNKLANDHNALITQLSTANGNDEQVNQLRALAATAIKNWDYIEADNQLAKAQQLDEEALSKQQKAIKQRTQSLALTHFERGKLHEANLQYQQARVFLEKAVELVPDNGLYANGAGYINNTLARYQQAIEYFELALAFDLSTCGQEHPNVASDRNNIGMAWLSLGEYHKAIEYFELALASDLNTYGQEHSKVAVYRNNIGGAWGALGEYRKAIEYYELALASAINSYGKEHPKVALRRNNIGMAWQSLGEYHKAIEYFELTLASDLNTYGQDHPDVAMSRNNIGLTLYSLGENHKAIESYQQALVIFEKFFDPSHPHCETVRENLAIARAEQKNPE
ncbi:MAG: tetratricopeptide (TPR) repeat protein [Phenylobacterium sp.]|jgi:tetratricopeptide (TPR) repeat protein